MASANNSTYTFEDARLELKRIRDEQLRNSDLVIDLWEYVLYKNSHKFGDEIWAVYEQVAIAALDCNRLDIAKKCIIELKQRFPESNRVRKLLGMQFEAYKLYDDADRIYALILKSDPTNSVAWKRKIAMHKSRGNRHKAIEELVAYLKKCMIDYDSWMELCDLYLGFLDYPKASFCMEELLLSNPHNHLYNQKYAEILYSWGGHENLDKSRSYFAQATKLNGSNTRSLYGFWLATGALASHPKSNAETKYKNLKYMNWASQRLITMHQVRLRSGFGKLFVSEMAESSDSESSCITDDDIRFLDAALSSVRLTNDAISSSTSLPPDAATCLDGLSPPRLTNDVKKTGKERAKKDSRKPTTTTKA